jgi:hypothetical protein
VKEEVGGMILAVEASRSYCQPPSVKSEIDFDPEFAPAFPE